MKKNYKNLLLGVASMVCASSFAQVSAYIFAQSNGTYTPITGGTVVATATANTAPGNLASTVWNMPAGTIPFPFTFNGTAYTGFNISCNGYITFGVTPPVATNGSPISATTAYDGAICAWGRTNNGVFSFGTGTPLYTSELRMEVLGAAPSRTFVIQFDNWRYSSGTTSPSWLTDFQIRLIETTNVVEIMYGPGVMAGGSLTTSGFTAQVGLRGATSADFNNRMSFGLFDQSTPGTANTSNQAIGVTNGVGVFMPPSGLTYKWYPPCSSGTPVTPSITATPTIMCTGDPLSFTASGETPYINITYQWQQSTAPGGPYTNVPSAGTTFATYQTSAPTGTLYYVLVTTCPTNSTSATSNQVMIDVRPLPVIGLSASPALNTALSPVQTCFGGTYTLTASGASSYSWSTGPVTASNVVSPANDPTYTVTGISVDGCVSTRTIQVHVNPLPVINILATPPAICPGSSVVIGATGNSATYTWIPQNTTLFMITESPTVSTTYSVMGTAVTGCTNIATHQVNVHSVSPVTITTAASATVCKGQNITLTASGSDTYVWIAPGTYTIGPLVTLAPQANVSYTVTGTDVNGCTSQATRVQSVADCVGLNENTGSFTGLQVYPNPNNGIFTVELSNGAAKTLDVMDLTGKVVLSASTSDDRAELNISQLAGGIYYLRVQSDNMVQIVKVVKQ